MAICKWCGEENPDGINVCNYCGQDMSIFEDSGMLKNLNTGANPVTDASRPRTAPAGVAQMNSGSFNSGAVRAASRTQQPQKKAEYVTRNQLKQVAYRLDQKTKTLATLLAVAIVAAVIGIAVGALAFVRGGVPAEDTAADGIIEQLQSHVSTLELELQSVNAKLAEMQEKDKEPVVDTTVQPSNPDHTNNGSGVDITTTDDPPATQPGSSDADTPSQPAPDTAGGNTLEADTEIETTFKTVDGDTTSIYAVIDQTFEGTTTYQWQKSANLETWNDVNTSAAKTERLKISIDDYLRNNAYRCRITNVDSKGITTVYYTENVDYNAYEIWKLIG